MVGSFSAGLHHSIALLQYCNEIDVGMGLHLTHDRARSPDKTGDFGYTYIPTPGGAYNGAGSVPTSAVVINEVADKGTDAATCGGQDWVELKNTGNETLDISSYMLCDRRGCDEADRYIFPGSTSIPAGEYKLICGDPNNNASSEKFVFGIGGRCTLHLGVSSY